MLLLMTDAEVRRHGYRTGLETPVVHAENDVCRCRNMILGTYCTFFISFIFLLYNIGYRGKKEETYYK